MKIGELRDFIKTHNKEQLEYLVAELYKLIPNDKKVDYNIDEWIQHPSDKNEKKGVKKPVKTNKIRNIQEIAKEVESFCSNAYAQNYLLPNQSISKKERPKWRFVVKSLYMEIQAALDAGNHPLACVKELEKLYEVMTYACDWQLFSAYDSFESMGIGQSEFFRKLVTLYRNNKDLNDFIRESIRLIIDNPLNRYTLYSELIEIFIAQCNTNDLLALCFEQVGIIRKDVLQEPEKESVVLSYSKGNKNEMSYAKREKLNNLTEIGFKAKVNLFEYEIAIAFFYEHYIERDPEVKLYILVSLLFDNQLKSHIVSEIESNKGLKPRKTLLNLLQYIKVNDDLPKYM
ncbi:MAG: hypothetical protein Q8S18_13755 [Bacteroidales bacterium]|nr:hypothetical protein [Bacteroidales bacterium]